MSPIVTLNTTRKADLVELCARSANFIPPNYNIRWLDVYKTEKWDECKEDTEILLAIFFYIYSYSRRLLSTELYIPHKIFGISIIFNMNAEFSEQ